MTRRTDHDIWAPTLGLGDLGLAVARLDDTVAVMRAEGITVPNELQSASRTCLEQAWHHYLSPDPEPELRNGWAFLVPARGGFDPLCGVAEARAYLPIIEALVAHDLAPDRQWQFGQRVLRILEAAPPTVIDRYAERPGAVIYVPVTSLLLSDAPTTRDGVRIARRLVADGVAFAQRLGAQIIGLGGTLPAVTNFGKSIQVTGRRAPVITTGHAGTAWLAANLVRRALDDGVPGPASVGVLGTGAVGSAIAEAVAAHLPGVPLAIFDHDPRAVRRSLTRLSRPARVAESAGDLFRTSSVVVSAITSPIDVHELGPEALAGRIIIDDGQPTAFAERDIDAGGGRLWWVVGTSHNGLRRASDLNYGGTLVSNRDLFGCEAEAAVLAQVPPTARRSFAIQEAADAAATLRMGSLLVEHGIEPSRPQCDGRLV